MKITFLGTGTSQGVPMIACNCPVCASADARDQRLRSSVLIEFDEGSVVIDAGPDFRYQMLRAKVQKLDAILLTHEHKDHIAGLDDIRAFNHTSGKPMDIYAETPVIEALKREFYYVFAERKYPGVPEMNVHQIDIQPFTLLGLDVVPIRVYHHKLPVLGFRIGDFAYITDVNYIEPSEMKKLEGLKHLVVSGLRKEKHVSHFTFQEAVDVIQALKSEHGYITHISHQLGLYEDIQHELPPHIMLAYDQLTIRC